MVSFGLSNGLILLPVLLSLVGSRPHPTSDNDDYLKGLEDELQVKIKLTPQHPASTSDIADDLYSKELSTELTSAGGGKGENINRPS